MNRTKKGPPVGSPFRHPDRTLREAALKELVEAKVNHAPVPKDEVSKPKRNNVVNLMDALRKSVGGGDSSEGEMTGKKKPAKSEGKKGSALVKAATKATAKRRSA